ncbi:MAG: AAA family ATPase [Bacteroidia bacterium]|nr:AAA family ATPase [Bacteroidia bacterium]
MKLVASPYFGRIDFKTAGDAQSSPVYIGIHTFTEDHSNNNLIYDWRAPVSSMFYDYELGPAGYVTPRGRVEGEIALKRQYKITEGRMEFMIENAVNIHDEVLQRELSKSSDDKMKNIVATIQRDQNAVIRNETAKVMIIQGVAGSGKTSIALHRIAFLLYRFRDTIAAKDILIISPNKVFADYISNVLPELGEEHIPEMGMEELASDVLERKYNFQTFFQQVTALLTDPHEGFVERIRYKASMEFLSELNRYMIYIENNFFEASELKIAGTVVPHPYIQERFKAYSRMPMLKRIPEVVREIQQYVRGTSNRKLSARDKAKIWEAVPRMFRFSNVFDIYKHFYTWNKKPHLFRMMHGSKLEYADVFPLLYCKLRLEGASAYEQVKHLLVDEMQDYTPVQYAVLSRLFNCKKTILGDVNQKVNPVSASSADLIETVFPHADIVRLFRSYRSTWEIAQFAQAIQPNPELVAMERHGDMPAVVSVDNHEHEVRKIKELAAAFEVSGYQSLGIICKTQEQAKRLHDELHRRDINLLTPDSTSFKEGIILATVHLAKGLEFDDVIIPFASVENYRTEMDRSMLYIACTRAMHKLTLTCAGARSTLLPA